MINIFTIILFSWTVSLLLSGIRFKHNIISRQLPASYIAQLIILKSNIFLGLLFLLLSLTTLILSYAFSGLTGYFSGMITVLILAPLPLYIIDIIREDTFILATSTITVKTMPISTRPSKDIKCGQITEVPQTIYFFILNDNWAVISDSGLDGKTYFAEYRISPGLYKIPVTNDVMQVFDSLQLYPKLVHYDNEEFIQYITPILNTDPLSYQPPAQIPGQDTLPPQSITTDTSPAVTTPNTGFFISAKDAAGSSGGKKKKGSQPVTEVVDAPEFQIPNNTESDD